MEIIEKKENNRIRCAGKIAFGDRIKEKGFNFFYPVAEGDLASAADPVIPKITQKLADRRVQSPGIEIVLKGAVLNLIQPLSKQFNRGSFQFSPFGCLSNGTGIY